VPKVNLFILKVSINLKPEDEFRCLNVDMDAFGTLTACYEFDL